MARAGKDPKVCWMLVKAEIPSFKTNRFRRVRARDVEARGTLRLGEQQRKKQSSGGRIPKG